MHRILMKSNWKEKREYVNHINFDTLDNRKENLEIVSNETNSCWRSVPNSNSVTGVRNVNWDARNQAYIVQISKEGEKFSQRFKESEFELACQVAEQKRFEIFGQR